LYVGDRNPTDKEFFDFVRHLFCGAIPCRLASEANTRQFNLTRPIFPIVRVSFVLIFSHIAASSYRRVVAPQPLFAIRPLIL